MTAERIADLLVAEVGNARMAPASDIYWKAAKYPPTPEMRELANEALADVRRLLNQRDELCRLIPSHAAGYVEQCDREILAVARALREKIQQP